MSLMEKAVASVLTLHSLSRPPSFNPFTISTAKRRALLFLCCSNSSTAASTSWSPTPETTGPAPPVLRKRSRYRKLNPGETTGITEEMRFVAMRLRNKKGKKLDAESGSDDNAPDEESETDTASESEGSWEPSVKGFINYLVDSKLVFDTVERIVDQSDDVAYAYFRKTGLERSESISKDLEWFREQGNVIPEPNNPGVSYAKYLEELGETSAPLFLCHFYNIYFSHMTGGQAIARQVSQKLLQGRELELYTWEGDVQELLKGVREKLNMLGEHWNRDDKNKCLRETTKSFRYLGQIIRLIILEVKH